MCSKFIKLVVLLSLLVCCGFAGRVLYSRFSQLCRTRERSTSHFVYEKKYLFPKTIHKNYFCFNDLNESGLSTTKYKKKNS